MSKLKLLKKKRTAAVALLLLVFVVGVGYAYWTAGGSGTGSADAGTTSALTVTQTTALTAMYPGDSPQTISGKFNNNTNPGPIYVGTVTASIASVVKATGAPAGTCDATDFTLASAVMTVNAEVPVGIAQGAWTGATLKFNNKASNQDACKLATVNLAYTIG